MQTIMIVQELKKWGRKVYFSGPMEVEQQSGAARAEKRRGEGRIREDWGFIPAQRRLQGMTFRQACYRKSQAMILLPQRAQECYLASCILAFIYRRTKHDVININYIFLQLWPRISLVASPKQVISCRFQCHEQHHLYSDVHRTY